MSRYALLVFFLFILSLTCASTGSSGGSFKNGIKEVNNGIAKGATSSRPMRVAVIPFQSTSRQSSGNFGIFAAETLMADLKDRFKKFRIFERSRLDVIMKENAISVSGIMKKENIKRIGELAPIDGLILGTYTVLENYVVISCRLVSVIDGEILATGRARIPLKGDISIFFKKQKPKIITPKQQTDCREKWNNLSPLFRDLKSENQRNRLSRAIRRIPMDSPCYKLHSHIISKLIYYRINDKAYHNFLMKEVQKIKYPYRVSSAVMEYFAMDNNITNSEWRVGLMQMKKAYPHGNARHLRKLIYNRKGLVAPRLIIINRLKEYMNIAKKGEMPLVIYDRAAVAAVNTVFRSYSRVPRDDKLVFLITDNAIRGMKDYGLIRINNAMLRGYYETVNNSYKDEYFSRVCKTFNMRQSTNKLGTDFMSIHRSFNSKYKMRKRTFRKSDLKVMVKKCYRKLQESLPLTKYPRQKEDRILFALNYNIKIPGFVPTVDQCIKNLYKGTYHSHKTSLRYLAAMGPYAKKAARHVRKNIRKYEVGGEYQRSFVIVEGLKTLGSIGILDRATVKIFERSLKSYSSHISKAAVDGYARMGKTAVPMMNKYLLGKDTRLKYRALEILKRMGKDAKGSLWALRRLRQRTRSYSLKDKIDFLIEDLR